MVGLKMSGTAVNREGRPAGGEVGDGQFEANKEAFDEACAKFDRSMDRDRAWVNPANWHVHHRHGARIYRADMFSNGRHDPRNRSAAALRRTHQALAESFRQLPKAEQRRLVPWPTFSLSRDISGIEPVGADYESDHHFLSQNGKRLEFEFDFPRIVAGLRAGKYCLGLDAAQRATTPEDGIDKARLGQSWYDYHKNYLDSVSHAAYYLTYGVYQLQHADEYLTDSARTPHEAGFEAIEDLDDRLSRFYIDTLAHGDNQTRILLTDWIIELHLRIFRHDRVSMRLANYLLENATTNTERGLALIGRQVLKIGSKGPGLNVYEWN